MASRMDKWGWELPYAGYFGGVATLSVKQFEQVLKLRPLGDNFLGQWLLQHVLGLGGRRRRHAEAAEVLNF